MTVIATLRTSDLPAPALECLQALIAEDGRPVTWDETRALECLTRLRLVRPVDGGHHEPTLAGRYLISRGTVAVRHDGTATGVSVL